MRLLGLVVVISILTACGGETDRGSENPVSGPNLFPPTGAIDNWKTRSGTKRFSGAELYGHINGGAEIFLDLGFERLDVQKYAQGKRTITVDIYHMADRAAALGIYLMKCGKETPSDVVDARHTVNQYQLLATAGAVYLTITDVDGTEPAGATLAKFARYIMRSVPDAGNEDLFAALPVGDRIVGSERIIRGQFTLQAIYTLGPGDILQLNGETTALCARYRSGAKESFTRLVADYPSAAAAKNAFDHLGANLDSYLEVITSRNGQLLFKDYAGKFGLVELDDARLDLSIEMARQPE